jgi:hypothetical protein
MVSSPPQTLPSAHLLSYVHRQMNTIVYRINPLTPAEGRKGFLMVDGLSRPWPTFSLFKRLTAFLEDHRFWNNIPRFISSGQGLRLNFPGVMSQK